MENYRKNIETKSIGTETAAIVTAIAVAPKAGEAIGSAIRFLADLGSGKSKKGYFYLHPLAMALLVVGVIVLVATAVPAFKGTLLDILHAIFK